MISINNPDGTTKPLDNARVSKLEVGNRYILAIGLASTILSITILTWSFFRAESSLFLIAGAFAFSAVTSILLRFQFPFLKIDVKAFIASLLLQISLLLVSASFSNLLIPLILISLILTFITSVGILSGFLSNISFAIGMLLAMAIALLNTYTPFSQIPSTPVIIIAYVVLGILALILLAFLLTGIVRATLQVKLIVVFLLVALIPLLVLSIIQTSFLQNALLNQTQNSLKIAAQQVSSAIDDFINFNLETITRQAELPVFSDYLNVPEPERAGSTEEANVFTAFRTLQLQRETFSPSYLMINRFGICVIASNPDEINRAYNREIFYQRPLLTGRAFVSPVLFSAINEDASLYFSAPVLDASRQIIGVLVIRYNALVLQDLIKDYQGLIGSRSYPILLDENYLRLADTITPNLLYKTLAPLTAEQITELRANNRLPFLPDDQISSNMLKFDSAVRNYGNQPFFTAETHSDDLLHEEIGTTTKLTSQTWFVAFVEEQTTLISLRNQQNRVSTLLAALFAGIVGLVGILVSSLLANPIIQLTSTAEKISKGDLEAKASVRTQDEIGVLADSFNAMTYQLRTFINELEERVQARTQELANRNEALIFRGRQLQTVADVAREIAQAQNLESLLDSLVNLVSQRFEFYHAGIFLLDEQKEFAVLRAANSEGGKRMLERQHKLKVGEVGMVGYVTGSGKPRIATDVGEDAVYFQNPDLPLTRSEMTLPLIVGDQIIGAVDVQSTISNAFTQEDIELFSTLADQVAIAIQNNLLYQETVRALEESRSLHRQYLLQEWSQETADRDQAGYQYTPVGLTAIEKEDLATVRRVIDEGETVIIPTIDEKSGKTAAALGVPIKLRGETIGVIHIQETSEEKQDWSPEEVDTVKSIADQVALALENARLFEQTIRRAERERKVLEITGKIRSTTDPKNMVQIAIEELQRVLKATRAQILIQDTSSVEKEEVTNIEQSENE